MIQGPAAVPVPAKVLEQDVLGRADVELAFRAGHHQHPLSAIHLLGVQRCSSSNEQVHLVECVLVDQVGALLLPDGSLQGVTVSVEFVAQRQDERFDLPRGHGDNDIHIQRRSRLTRD